MLVVAQDGPRISSAPRRKSGVLRGIRGTQTSGKSGGE
jgi:hypothetical protein